MANLGPIGLNLHEIVAESLDKMSERLWNMGETLDALNERQFEYVLARKFDDMGLYPLLGRYYPNSRKISDITVSKGTGKRQGKNPTQLWLECKYTKIRRQHTYVWKKDFESLRLVKSKVTVRGRKVAAERRWIWVMLFNRERLLRLDCGSTSANLPHCPRPLLDFLKDCQGAQEQVMKIGGPLLQHLQVINSKC